MAVLLGPRRNGVVIGLFLLVILVGHALLSAEPAMAQRAAPPDPAVSSQGYDVVLSPFLSLIVPRSSGLAGILGVAPSRTAAPAATTPGVAVRPGAHFINAPNKAPASPVDP